MAALVLVALMTARASAVGAAPAAAAPVPAAGFDHLIHRTRVEVGGQTNPPCAHCHRLTTGGMLASRPGHAACFPCHGPAPRRAAAAPSPPPAVCVACHPPAGLASRRPTLAAVTYGPDREYGLQLDHAVHTAPCARCHTTGARVAAPALPHARCVGCHLTQAPVMTACEGCHPSEVGPDARPHLRPAPLSVARAYSHRDHAARAGGAAAATCAACHQAITVTHERALPTPTAAACSAAGCHEGTAAFAITTACTRCHPAPAGGPSLPSPQTRFGHRQHEGLTAIAACQGCHGLDARGQPTAPAHAACSDAACHRADFGSPTPTTCGACHLASEPWRHLLADQRPPDDSERGVALSHRRHPGRCEDCHQLTTALHPLRPPRGHGACTAAGCHATDRGPAPRLTACAGCHQPGVVDERRRRRSLALWSVAATFEHDRHRVDPRDRQPHRPTPSPGVGAEPGPVTIRGPLACTACHQPADAAADDAAATTGDEPMPPPAKATCAPCHDGAIAFKMTGHGCARCHGHAPEPP